MKPHEETTAERDARRERLRLLCALDRARLRLAFRPRPVAAGRSGLPVVGGLSRALTMAAFLPGAAGRWSRRLAAGLRVLKNLGT
jgi:hypothetical protein